MSRYSPPLRVASLSRLQRTLEVQLREVTVRRVEVVETYRDFPDMWDRLVAEGDRHDLQGLLQRLFTTASWTWEEPTTTTPEVGQGSARRTEERPPRFRSGRSLELPDPNAHSNPSGLRLTLTQRVTTRRAVRGRHVFRLVGPPKPPQLQPPQNPIRRADVFQAAYERLGTCSRVATEFGCSDALVSYHLGLLKRLPADFVEWARGVEDSAWLRVLSQRRLRQASRLVGAEQRRCLKLMRQEIE